MGSQRSLLKSLSVDTAGRLHYCHSNKKHVLRKGDGIFIVKEGRSKTHYCLDCGQKFVATAQKNLEDLQAQISNA